MIGRIIGWDIETAAFGSQGTQYPYLFQIYGGKGVEYIHENKTLSSKSFTTAFIKFLDDFCLPNDVFVNYNLGFDGPQTFFRQDLQVINRKVFRRFQVGNKVLTVTGILDNPTPFLECYFNDGRKIYFIDSSKFFEGLNLADVAKQYSSISKMERPSCIGRIPSYKERSNYFKYAMIDAQVCYELGLIIKKYHDLASLKNVTFSVAHLAGTSFNQNFCDSRKLDNPGPGIEGAAYWAKFGGYRCSFLKQGIYKNYSHLDIVSLYPWAYSNMKAYFDGRYFQTMKLEPEGIYKIQTVLPKDEIQPLFLGRVKHRIIMQPLNTPVTFWTTEPEISVYNKIHKAWKYRILNGYVWRGQNSNRPLAKWVALHFAEKSKYQKGTPDEYKRNFHKDMLNHLTGKFDASISTNEECYITSEGEKDFSTKRPGMLRNYFVAAVLRAKARAKVWFDAYGLSGQFMTDSIDIPMRYATKKYFDIGSNLGQWAVEVPRGDMVFYRNGAYLYFDSIKKTSLPPLKNALHGFQNDWHVFLGLLRLGGGWYERHKMMRIKESLRKDGGLSAFKFYDKPFEFKNVSKKLQEEVTKWLKGKRLKIRMYYKTLPKVGKVRFLTSGRVPKQ